MVSFTSPVIEAVVAGALATRRYIVYEPFLTVSGIHRMKNLRKYQTSSQSSLLKAQGTKESGGTVNQMVVESRPSQKEKCHITDRYMSAVCTPVER